MKKIKLLIVLLSLFYFCFAINTTKFMYFKAEQGATLLINGEQSFPQFNEKITDYYARSFSALKKIVFLLEIKHIFIKQKQSKKMT